MRPGALPPITDSVFGFMNALPHAVIVADAQGKIEAANRAAEAMLRYGDGELEGCEIEDLVPHVLRAGHAQLRKALGEAGGHRATGPAREFRALRKDGTQVSVMIGLCPWEGPGGRRFVACVIDNEPQHRSELEAESDRRSAFEAAALSHAIIRDAPIGIIMYEIESGRCVSANEAAASITGVSNAQLLSQDFRRIASWHDSGMLEAAEDAIGAGRPVARDISMVTTAGKRVALHCSFLVIQLHENPHLVLMINDQTARRDLEEQVRVAQKMEAIGQLAGGVAHDFNNLLTVIGTYSSLLIEQHPPGDPTREDLEEVYGAAQRAATLTRQLLAFGRRQLLDSRLLSLNDIATNLEKMLRRVLSAEITLELKLAPDLGMIHADAGQMEQAVMNLVVNARDAMPNGGRITIETLNVEEPPDAAGGHDPARRFSRRLVPRQKVLLRIADTGTGMDEATMARIFEPFFTTKPAGKGTGLGLATTYGIVKQTGGTINVRSVLGEGTTFDLHFRRMSAPPSAVAPSVVQSIDAGGTGEVLVVEDDEHVRRIVVETLTTRGYSVIAANHGKQALEIALSRDRSPDLVVTDLVMPELSGRELVRRLRERWPGLRVLFMTAYAVDEATGEAATDLQGGLLRKPFVPTELGAAVREVLG